MGLNPGPLNLQATPLTTGPQVVDKIMQALSFKHKRTDYQSKFVSKTLLSGISTMMRVLLRKGALAKPRGKIVYNLAFLLPIRNLNIFYIEPRSL